MNAHPSSSVEDKKMTMATRDHSGYMDPVKRLSGALTARRRLDRGGFGLRARATSRSSIMTLLHPRHGFASAAILLLGIVLGVPACSGSSDPGGDLADASTGGDLADASTGGDLADASAAFADVSQGPDPFGGKAGGGIRGGRCVAHGGRRRRTSRSEPRQPGLPTELCRQAMRQRRLRRDVRELHARRHVQRGRPVRLHADVHRQAMRQRRLRRCVRLLHVGRHVQRGWAVRLHADVHRQAMRQRRLRQHVRHVPVGRDVQLERRVRVRPQLFGQTMR